MNAVSALLQVRNDLIQQLEQAQEVRALGAKPTAEEALQWAISSVTLRLRAFIAAEGVNQGSSTTGSGGG